MQRVLSRGLATRATAARGSHRLLLPTAAARLREAAHPCLVAAHSIVPAGKVQPRLFSTATLGAGTSVGDDFRAEHEVVLHGDISDVDVDPVLEFKSLERTNGDEREQLPKRVMRYFDSKGYTAPSTVQAQSMPLTLAGRDVVAVAQTGSGKTLGFLVPLFWHVAAARRNAANKMGPLAVVLAPTRELAQQIEREAQAVGDAFGCTSVCVYGGQDKRLQERNISRMRKRLDLVVATPGRLCDFIRDRVLPMHAIKFLVLDEADRMLDMGFEPQLREVAETMPEASDGRQTMMFSATWPKEVKELAADFLNRPVRINIGGSDGNLVANKDISQHVELHENTVTKLESLSALLTNMDESVGPRSGCHSVVFVARKRDADMVAADIRDSFRNVLHNVKSGRVQVLVATDVAARGLDVRSIQQVINFDMPTNMEDYIHRIGRTGRAGAKGEAHTFVHPKMDASHVLKLCKVMSDHEQPIPPELSALADSVDDDDFQ